MTLNHNNYDLLNIVSNEYSKQLIHLNIDFDFIDCNNLSNALKVISSFIHLQRLELFIARDPKINIKPIDSLFTEIAINCLKITHLSVIFERKSTHQLICGNIFAVLGCFTIWFHLMRDYQNVNKLKTQTLRLVITSQN